MSLYKTLNDVDVSGKVVFVRADLNVPAQEGKITDNTRIVRLAPTLRELSERGAKVVIASHFGRPKGKIVPEMSLRIVLTELENNLGAPVQFCDDCIGEKVQGTISQLKEGQYLLLENLRFYAEEEKNDASFASDLSKGMDIFVNDAFSCAHRAHASTQGITEFLPSYAGRLMQAELEALEGALGQNPTRPVGALIGGSKVSTKLELLSNLVQKVDYLFIGGGMAHTFLAAEGYPMGKGSLVEPTMIDTAKEIMKKAGNCKVLLPTDLIYADAFAEDQEPHEISLDEIPEGKVLLDIGSKSVEAFAEGIKECRTLIWNGPVGAFEIKPFDAATNALAKVVAEETKEGRLTSVAGGGDTVSALNKANVSADFTYISAAGGAFLEWMEGKTLPGVEPLKK
ncbi:MAG: phosphoglycerate kinase [Alphaproteobacteria bacterium]|nr:phosphoglycerate kinase [Alphaproteobacteria bacterium]